MKSKNTRTLAAAIGVGLSGFAMGQNPAVVVSVENMSPYSGTFLTPVWVGFHNGQFDSYNGGTLANTLPIPGSDAIERLAEDGNTAPITRDFDTLVPNGSQGTIRSNGPIPPIGPSQITSQLFEVDPSETQYFSYGSMILPSNDAMIMNGSPFAHPIFNDSGEFVGTSFYVTGGNGQVNDVGTEVNDEVPANTAFFGQTAPNTGVTENLPISSHPGFLDPSEGGILASPRFEEGDFLQPNFNVARFNFTFIDKDAPVLFEADLDATFEFPNPELNGANPSGRAFFFLDDGGESLVYFAFASGLTGDLTAAHLHLAPLTQNGPIVLPLDVLFGRFAFGRIDASALVGPVGSDAAPLDKLVAEMTTGTSYVNFHTEQNPAGEIRGQVRVNTAQ